MWKRALKSAVMAIWLTAALCLPASAQTQTKAPAPTTADPGVTVVTIMDEPEVRILRVEVQPGGARRVHQHDDVTFHLFVPLNGTLQLSVGSNSPIDVAPGQVNFMKKGTPHAFRNVGASPVTLIEVFVKPSVGAARADRDALRALMLASGAALN